MEWIDGQRLLEASSSIGFADSFQCAVIPAGIAGIQSTRTLLRQSSRASGFRRSLPERRAKALNSIISGLGPTYGLLEDWVGMRKDLACLPNDLAESPNDLACLQNDLASMQNHWAGFPDGFASLHNGCACMPNGFARLNNGCASLPNDLAMMQDDFAVLSNLVAGLQNDFANWSKGLVIKRSLDGACGIQVNGVKNHPVALLACDSKECLWLRSFLDFVALHSGYACFDWSVTPMIVLYEKHINCGKPQDRAIADAAKDGVALKNE
ncbi:MAG: hypothetical protein PHE55_05240 [Methylococcaceae bacterium]|nr:hypothetical protein [Methylococcaceae bacterium]